MDADSMAEAELLEAMTDDYIARRRPDGEFDDDAAVQVFRDWAPRMTETQAQAFTRVGGTDSPEGWKLVLREQLAQREGVSPD